jgi:ADP-dependent phosphofructokinase/glucokinase
MPKQEQVREEVLKHKVSEFSIVGIDSEELAQALEYLRREEKEMADHLEWMAKKGLVRAGL